VKPKKKRKTAGGAKRPASKRKGTATGSITGGTASDEALFLTGTSGIWRFAKGRLEQIGDKDGIGSVFSYAATSDGTLWVVSKKKQAVAAHKDDKWTEHAIASMGAAGEKLRTVGVAADGSAIAFTDKAIRALQAGTWKKLIELEPKEDSGRVVSNGKHSCVVTKKRVFRYSDGTLTLLFEDKAKYPGPGVALSPAGVVIVTSSRGAKRYEGTKGKAVAGIRKKLYRSVSAPDGALYGIDGFPGTAIVAITPDGKVTRHPVSYKIDELTVDGRGRVWAASELGPLLLESGKIHYWANGTIPEIRDEVDHIIVTGKGPDLPEVNTKLFTLKGRAVDSAGKPLAGAKLEICKNASLTYYGPTPCNGKHFIRRATSAKDGTFELTNIPRWGWSLMGGHKNKWYFKNYTSKVNDDRVIQLDDLTF